VIGGGDWAEDRIMPDCTVRFRLATLFACGVPRVRLGSTYWNPQRLSLARCPLMAAVSPRAARRTRLIFGPAPESHREVRALVEEVLRYCQGAGDYP